MLKNSGQKIPKWLEEDIKNIDDFNQCEQKKNDRIKNNDNKKKNRNNNYENNKIQYNKDKKMGYNNDKNIIIIKG